MVSHPVIEFIAREHPAWVHVPLGMVVGLPLAMLGSFLPKHAHRWTTTAFFMAAVGLAGSLVALVSGLIWARQINLLPPSGYFPVLTSSTQVLQRMMQLHEIAALAGVVVGSAVLWLLWGRWRPLHISTEDTAIHVHRQLGRRWWERGVGAPALLLSLLWLAAWGVCGRLGGIMVFGNEEINKAAAAAEKAKKQDAEADLPIRALDYAGLEPTADKPIRSAAHGGRWIRTWVTASGIDAYKAGKALPPGSYVVLSSAEDEKGRPSYDPGPLFMKEVLGDGRVAFSFYWARVPEKLRSQTGGEDSVYWRSPSDKVAACAKCHTDARPGRSSLPPD